MILLTCLTHHLSVRGDRREQAEKRGDLLVESAGRQMGGSDEVGGAETRM